MKKNKYVLGIETSCDDTSIAIIEVASPNKVLTHITAGQEDILKVWGGVVPEIAARNHLEKILPLLKASFKNAKISPEEIDLIAVTGFPGLLGPLLTGVNAAKTLALKFKKPILPVNHLYAHLEAIHLTQKIDYPYLGLLVSGGHSLYFKVMSSTDFTLLGGTIDDASGEAFDKGGKLLGLGYPAGHIIDRLSHFGDDSKFDFPIGLKSSADAKLSFSGLKTSLRVFLDKNPKIKNAIPSQFETKENLSQDFYDLCASYQKAIVDALLLKLRYAIKSFQAETKGTPQIVVGGGVACNSLLRSKLTAKFPNAAFVSPEFCTDNGAMIANYGALNMGEKIPFPECLGLDARSRFIQKNEISNG